MPVETAVDQLYQDFQELLSKIDIAEVSLQTTLRTTFSKSLMMAVAGYFEEQVQQQIIGFVDNRTSGNELLKELVIHRAFGRQYHTLFNWDRKNANSFFSLFGNNFSESMTQHIKECDDYGEAIRAFLEIGNARNELAHGNYAQFPLDKTTEEIYDRYKVALLFVNSIGSHLERVSNSSEAPV